VHPLSKTIILIQNFVPVFIWFLSHRNLSKKTLSSIYPHPRLTSRSKAAHLNLLRIAVMYYPPYLSRVKNLSPMKRLPRFMEISAGCLSIALPARVRSRSKPRQSRAFLLSFGWIQVLVTQANILQQWYGLSTVAFPNRLEAAAGLLMF